VENSSESVLFLKNLPALKEAIQSFETEFFDRYEKLRKEVYTVGSKLMRSRYRSGGKIEEETDARYPVTGSEWIDRVTQAINSALEVSKVAGKISTDATTLIQGASGYAGSRRPGNRGCDRGYKADRGTDKPAGAKRHDRSRIGGRGRQRIRRRRPRDKRTGQQSAQAAENIAFKIDGVQGNTQDAIKVIAEVSEIIDTINESIGVITNSVEQQSRTAANISSNIDQAAKGATDMASSIAEVAAGANEVSKNTGEAAKGANDVASNILGVSKAASDTNSGAQQVDASSGELAGIAGELEAIVSRFKVE